MMRGPRVRGRSGTSFRLGCSAGLAVALICVFSFAFTVGVIPLLFATGAGATSQRAIGPVVFGGMLASTSLAVPFVPVFYVVTQGIGTRELKETETQERR